MSAFFDVEPTEEDIDAQAFRVTRHMDPVNDIDRFMMIMYCLIGDYVDSEIMHRGVRSCESLREFGMHHEWLREDVHIMLEQRGLKQIEEYLKIMLDY